MGGGEGMTFFETLYRSATRFDAYAQLARRGPRRAAGYLALYLTLIFVLGGFLTLLDTSRALREIQPELARELPDFRIRNGRLTMDAPQPHFFTDGDTPLVVDTTGTLDAQWLSGYPTGFLATAEALHTVSGGRVSSWRWTDLNADLDRDDLIAGTSTLARILPWLALPWLLLFIAAKFISAVPLAWLAQMAARNTPGPLAFGPAWVVAAHALTVPVFIAWGLDRMGVNLPGGWLLYWAVAGFYAWRGGKAAGGPPLETGTPGTGDAPSPEHPPTPTL